VIRGFVQEKMAITQLMEWRASLLRDGRIEDLAHQFLFPMALYTNAVLRPVASADALAETLRNFRKTIAPEVLRYLEIIVTSVEIPRGGRFRVWSELVCRIPGQPVRVMGSTIHFMRETPQGIMAEMLECSFQHQQQTAVA
jgi:hypothetical protein